MPNQSNVPKIISSQKLSGVEKHKTVVSKIVKSLGYRQIQVLGSENIDIVDFSSKSSNPILFKFQSSTISRFKKFNKQRFIRLINNKFGRLTSLQQKIKKQLETVPIYTVVDEANDIVLNVPHSFLESKKLDQNDWEVPIYFSFFDKEHADFYCEDLNEEFHFLNKSFTVRTINLGNYYELVHTQGPKSLFYLFPDLEGINFAKKLPREKSGGFGIPSFGYKKLIVKNKKGEIWDGKFFNKELNERVTPVFLNYNDAVRQWKVLRSEEIATSKFYKLPRRAPIEYLKLDRFIFKTIESDFLLNNFLFYPSSQSFAVSSFYDQLN